MTDLIEKNDPRYFSQTSNEPYDRHHYKIISLQLKLLRRILGRGTRMVVE